MSHGTRPMWEEYCQRIQAELLRDKKKSAIMGVLLLVALIVGIKQLAKSGPESAQAYAVEVRSNGQENSAKSSGKDASGEPDSLEEDQIWDHEVSISRDIFSPNPDFFPVEESNSPTVRVVSEENEEALKAQERLAFEKMIQGQANSLSIQSTIISNNPTVMINGRLLHLGEEINGFIIEEITPRSCTVSKSEVKILLEMPN